MIVITNGVITLKVTEGAFKEVFKSQGFFESLLDTPTTRVEQRSDPGVKLLTPEPENVTESVFSQKISDSDTENFSKEKNTQSNELELSEIPLGQMTDKQLKEYADQLGVDIQGITSRKAVREKIKNAL